MSSQFKSFPRQRAMLTQPCPLLAFGKLAQSLMGKLIPAAREMAPLLITGQVEPTLPSRVGRFVAPVVRTDQLSYHLGPQAGLGLEHLNLHPI